MVREAQENNLAWFSIARLENHCVVSMVEEFCEIEAETAGFDHRLPERRTALTLCAH